MGEQVIGQQKEPGDVDFKTVRMIGLSEIESKVNIEDRAYDDAHRNFPDANDHSLGSSERQIVTLVEDHLHDIKKFAFAEKEFAAEKLEELDILGVDEGFTNVLNETKLKNEVEIEESKPKLLELRIVERKLLKDKNFFKSKNRIRTEASYPESHIYHLSIVFVFLLGECIGNMYFFAEGSSIGLLGGFLQAALVSVVNVGISYLAGWFVFTQMNHVSPARRWIGRIFSLAYLLLIVCFHFAVAHYRDLLTQDPDNAALMALERLRDDFFGLATIDSVLVLFMGIIIAGIACYKGYRHDDPYPGYGRVDRVHQEANRAYRAAVGKLRESVSSRLEEGANRITADLEKYESNVKEYKLVLSSFGRKQERYQDCFNNSRQVLHSALDKYREFNKSIRTDACPEYFDRYPELSVSSSFVEDLFATDEFDERLQKMEKKLETLRASSQKILETFPDQVEKMNGLVDRMEAQVDKKADKALSNEDKQQHQDQ